MNSGTEPFNTRGSGSADLVCALYPIGKFRSNISRKLLLLATLLLSKLTAPLPLEAVSTNILISQVYGGGGNSGATLRNDYVELFNRGVTAVDVSGWTVQYASATGDSWVSTVLNGSIAPGQYYLIQEHTGTGGTTGLPTPNAIGSINLSATAGKVALVSISLLLTGSCPTGAGIVDLVGYGNTANCYEGHPAPELSNITAALRQNDGSTDTDDNLSDFTVGSPNPRASVGGTVNPVSSDFNSDGKPDLVWQNQATGQIGVWFMDGILLSGVGIFNPGQVADTDWKLVATADFNTDSRPDLVWQNQSTGQIGVWFLDGTDLASVDFFNPGEVKDTNWKIVGTGDFNSDGKPDLVWQNHLGISGSPGWSNQ